MAIPVASCVVAQTVTRRTLVAKIPNSLQHCIGVGLAVGSEVPETRLPSPSNACASSSQSPYVHEAYQLFHTLRAAQTSLRTSPATPSPCHPSPGVGGQRSHRRAQSLPYYRRMVPCLPAIREAPDAEGIACALEATERSSKSMDYASTKQYARQIEAIRVSNSRRSRTHGVAFRFYTAVMERVLGASGRSRSPDCQTTSGCARVSLSKSRRNFGNILVTL